MKGEAHRWFSTFSENALVRRVNRRICIRIARLFRLTWEVVTSSRMGSPVTNTFLDDTYRRGCSGGAELAAAAVDVLLVGIPDAERETARARLLETVRATYMNAGVPPPPRAFS